MNAGLVVAIAVLIVASVAILVTGPKMASIADRLADVTGLGEAVVGAVLVGAATSLPDLFATITPALADLPGQAFGNALGGVLGQTAFLAVADLTYRRANLEHAAASLPNMLHSVLLVALLALIGLGLEVPGASIGGIHAVTIVLPLAYLYGLRIVSAAESKPMWRPTRTAETRTDDGSEESVRDNGGSAAGLVATFVALAAVLCVAGVALGRSGEVVVRETGISENAVGALLTGVSSSLAELVIAVAAVRQGALTLAVANVLGGNMFDTLLVAVADVSYGGGTVFADAGEKAALLVALAMLMTAAVATGLLRRELHGLGNIGAEGVVVLALYGVGIVLLL